MNTNCINEQLVFAISQSVFLGTAIIKIWLDDCIICKKNVFSILWTIYHWFCIYLFNEYLAQTIRTWSMSLFSAHPFITVKFIGPNVSLIGGVDYIWSMLNADNPNLPILPTCVSPITIIYFFYFNFSYSRF